jgi:hypothetical protein
MTDVMRHRLWLVVLTLGNLRGVRESGTIFMAPTYLYIVVVLGMIGFGLVGPVAVDGVLEVALGTELQPALDRVAGQEVAHR